MALLATLRSAQGHPRPAEGQLQSRRAVAQRGKELFVDNGPYNVVIDRETGISRVFIPAKVSDNPALLEADPRYVDRLKAVGSPERVRAWLEGDWNVVEGSFFPEFTHARHVIPPFPIPADWTKFRDGLGLAQRRSAFGWWAVVQDDYRA